MPITAALVGQLAIANLFALAVLLTSIWRPRGCRWLLVILFTWASITNAVISLRNPQVYVEYAAFAQLDVYRRFILGPFAAHVAWLVVPIAIGQLAIAYLLTRKGLSFTLGIIGVTIFLAAITPLGVGAGGSFPIVVIVAAWILHTQRQDLDVPRDVVTS